VIVSSMSRREYKGTKIVIPAECSSFDKPFGLHAVQMPPSSIQVCHATITTSTSGLKIMGRLHPKVPKPRPEVPLLPENPCSADNFGVQYFGSQAY
jgi:hypothetical protein